MIPKSEAFDELVVAAQACRACPGMDGQIRVLTRNNGPINAKIMLVGEAPGRLGAGRSGVPFTGDESGRRLDRLIAAAGWKRDELFVTNALLCNPLDGAGRNRPPRAHELANCCDWLARQIGTIDPLLVVALGAVALKSLARIESHERRVRDSSSRPVNWNGRYLAGVYHPGARAAVHRPVPDQLMDFEKLGRWYARVAASATS